MASEYPQLESALAHSELDLVRSSLAQGRYRLLLGAGFSCSSLDSHGENLPVGGTLAKELAERFGHPTKYDLTTLTNVIPDTELDAFLTQRFAGCTPRAAALSVPTFVWTAIYTYNVDDVLPRAYKNDSALQELTLVNHRDPFVYPSDQSQLNAVHLHGTCLRPQEGYVFSRQQYADSVEEHNAWSYVFRDELADQPFMIVGCTLEEFDLEVLISRRTSSARIGARTAPSLFVTPSPDSVIEARCKRFGFKLVVADADKFFTELDRFCPHRPAVDELIRTPSARLTGPLNQERVFFSQWTHFADLDVLATDESPPLLSGVEPSAAHLQSGEILPRSHVAPLAADVLRWIKTGTARAGLRVVYGPSATGKTAALYLLGRALVEAGVAVYLWSGDARMNVDAAVSVLASSPEGVVLLVDDATTHAEQVTTIVAKLKTLKGSNVLVVGYDRDHRSSHLEKFTDEVFFESSTLGLLEQDEARSFVHALRRAGLLGKSAGETDEDLTNSFAGGDLLALLLRVGPRDRLLERLEAEVAEMTETHRQIYGVICLAHRHNHSLQRSVVARAAKCSPEQLSEALNSQLHGVVLVEKSGKLRARHRVVAEYSWKLVPDRFPLLTGLVAALRPYVSRKAIMRRQPEARLVGRLFDADVLSETIPGRELEFFAEVVDNWNWNSRFWEQRALAMLKVDPESACRYAEQAVGLEEHPMTYTTLAKVQFESARSAGFRDFSHRKRVVEALASSVSAIHLAKAWRRHEPHPHDVALRCGRDFIDFANANGIAITSTWEGWPLLQEVRDDLVRIRPRRTAAQLRRGLDLILKGFVGS